MKERINYSEQTPYKLLTKFEQYFKDCDDVVSYGKSADRLSMYVFASNEKIAGEYLIKFAKEYFGMKRGIVDLRNKILEVIKSNNFKNIKWVNRVQIRFNLNKQNKLCNLLNMFEQDFYNQTNISLLQVENDRWVKEQIKNKNQTIEF